MDGNDDPSACGVIEVHNDSFAIPLSEQKFHRPSLTCSQFAEGKLRGNMLVRIWIPHVSIEITNLIDSQTIDLVCPPSLFFAYLMPIGLRHQFKIL
jgi:hypothetical protein